MNRQFEMMNDVDSIVNENMRQRESVVRLMLSAALLSVFFIYPAMPFKFLYVVPALYLFTTALVKWDPVYAILKHFQVNYKSQKVEDKMMSSRMVDVDSSGDGKAVNDPSGSEFRDKKYVS